MPLIYLITCVPTGKYYVGQTFQTLEDRWSGHKSRAKSCRHNGHLQNAIRKYGPENFTIEVLTECSDEQVNNLERLWIAVLDSANNEVGFNVTPGGENGFRMSPEHKRKISESNMGKKRSPDYTYSPQHKKKISDRFRANLENRTFGRLTALWYMRGTKNGSGRWLCACECGGFKLVRTFCLTGGLTRSCGCLKVEAARKMGLTPPTPEERKRMSEAQKRRFARGL